MSARTVLSAKGQVVIPKDLRDSLGFKTGQALDVIQTGGGVLLRPAMARSGRSNAEILEDVRKITRRYEGPPVSIEEINQTIAEEWAKSGLRGDW